MKQAYMFKFHHQNAEKSHFKKTGDESFENMAKFKYLGMTVMKQNYIHEEIMSSLNVGIACYHSVQNLLSSSLSKYTKTETCKTIILPVKLGLSQ
jgi:hypothetical protein